MTNSDWSTLLAALQALGLKVISIDATAGRVVVEIPRLEQR